jgi:hypothetical protein
MSPTPQQYLFMLVNSESNGSVKVCWYLMEFSFAITLKICAFGPTAYWPHSHRHVNRLNLSSDGTYERKLHGLVFRRRGAATCSTPVRGVRSTRYCTFALLALFPKEHNAIRALGLEFWPETCVCFVVVV